MLADLIKRLEEATEGSQELNAAIWWEINRPAAERAYWRGALELPRALGDEMPTGGLGYQSMLISAPDFTRNLQVASTAVPEGCAWRVGTCCVSDDAWVVPDLNCPVHGERLRARFEPLEHGSIWDTGIDIDQRPSGRPAIALCRAALTARMEMAA